MSRIYLLVLLLLTVLPMSFAWGETVSPRQRFQMSYPLEGVTLRFGEGAVVPIRDLEGGEAFVEVRIDDAAHVVALPAKELQRTMTAIFSGNTVEFLTAFEIRVDKGYVLFLPGVAYEVEGREGDKLSLSRNFAGKERQLSLPARLFRSLDESPTPTRVSSVPETMPVSTAREPPGGDLTSLKSRYRFSSVSEPVSPDKAVCLFEDGEGSGTGFLFFENGNLYCYTNLHIIEGLQNPTIHTLDGQQVDFVAVEVAEDRDMARLLVSRPLPALQAKTAPVLRESITVLGNSQGAGRVTSLKGRVTGLNPVEVEISAGIVPGNSGSPILNDRNEVVGVAAYMQEIPMPEKFTRGTQFEEARRVGVRMKPAPAWVETDLSRLHRMATVYAEMEEFLKESGEVLIHMVQQPEMPVSVSQLQNTVLRKWALRRNEIIKERRATMPAEMTWEEFNALLAKTWREQFNHHRYLASLLSSREARLRGLRMVPDTDYNRARVEWLRKAYAELQEANQTFLNEMENYRP